jgi:bromodomain-containing protein 8
MWSTREKLCLASAVFKIGDQNWVSVSRAIKPYAEPSRPPEWFHQKNCLLQYYDLMEQLEQPKRKRGGDRSESDAPSLQIMRKMTIERSEQLKKEILEMQHTFKHIKTEVESIKAGLWDDHIQDVWLEIQEEQKNTDTQQKIEVKLEDDYDEIKTTVAEISDIVMPVGDADDSTQDTVGDISVLTDEEGAQSGSSGIPASTPASLTSTTESKLSSASHLLKLLKSDVKTASELQRLKHEQEQVQEQVQQQSQGSQQSILSQTQRSLLKTPVTQDDPLITSPSNTAPTLSRLLSTAKSQAEVISVIKSANASDVSLSTTFCGKHLEPNATTEDFVEETELTEAVENQLTAIDSNSATYITDMQAETADNNVLTPAVEESEELVKKEGVSLKEDEVEEKQAIVNQDVQTESTVKEELDTDSQYEDEVVPIKKSVENFANDAETTESSVKDEPLSPTSSSSSKISDAGSKKGIKTRGRPRSAIKSANVSIRKSYHTDDERKDEGESSRQSDVELSEDDIRESHDILTGQRASVNVSSILSESFPNSPASLSICSDTEEEKSFKQWKKSIMLVWRAAATHKYANVFLHPVTDEIAPGYRSVVLRPMDLSTIKKNVETGIIRSTVDFQHDMMLMFTNAIMYNSSDHNVFKMTKEMYDDVMQHIEQYVNTQMMIQTSDAKTLRQSRRTDTSDKEDEAKKRKLSVDQPEGGGKTKKRKIRTEETAMN